MSQQRTPAFVKDVEAQRALLAFSNQDAAEPGHKVHPDSPDVVVCNMDPSKAVADSLPARIEEFIKSGLNYMAPDRHNRLVLDLNTMLVVVSLLIAASYPPLFRGFVPDSGPQCQPPTAAASTNRSQGTCQACSAHTAFVACNYLAFGITVLAAFLVLGTTTAVRLVIPQPWPERWDQIQPLPNIISQQNFNEPGFHAVQRYAQALNFIWHARVHKLLPETMQQRLHSMVAAVRGCITLAFVLDLAAATIALWHQTEYCRLGAVVTFSTFGCCFLGLLVLVARFGWSTYWSTHRSMTFKGWQLAGDDGHELFSVPAQLPDSYWTSTRDPLLRNELEHTLAQYRSGHMQGQDDIFSIANGAGRVSNNCIWPAAVRLAGREALANKRPFEFTSQPALVYDDIWEWREAHPDGYYAVHVFRDPKKRAKALRHRAALEKFWNKLVRAVESKRLTLEDFFTTGLAGNTWLGRARVYRELGEQLDICAWYYFSKHLSGEQATDPRLHYCDGLTRGSGADEVLEEYHSAPALDRHKQPEIPLHRRRAYKFGEYEEWLVKGSYSRPERYRLIQEWEARADLAQYVLQVRLLRDVQLQLPYGNELRDNVVASAASCRRPVGMRAVLRAGQAVLVQAGSNWRKHVELDKDGAILLKLEQAVALLPHQFVKLQAVQPGLPHEEPVARQASSVWPLGAMEVEVELGRCKLISYSNRPVRFEAANMNAAARRESQGQGRRPAVSSSLELALLFKKHLGTRLKFQDMHAIPELMKQLGINRAQVFGGAGGMEVQGLAQSPTYRILQLPRTAAPAPESTPSAAQDSCPCS